MLQVVFNHEFWTLIWFLISWLRFYLGNVLAACSDSSCFSLTAAAVLKEPQLVTRLHFNRHNQTSSRTIFFPGSYLSLKERVGANLNGLL